MIETYPAHDRATWLQLRHRDVTASDVGALFGCHPFVTLLQLHAEKAGFAVDQGETIAMRRGKLMQPAVRQALIEDHGIVVTEPGDYVRDSELRIGCTRDYVLPGGEPVECKSVAYDVFDRDWTKGPPLHIQLQAVTQCALTGAKRCLVPVIIMNKRLTLKLYWVDAHAAAWEKIKAAVKAFWEAFARGELPAADFSRDAQAIAAIFARDTGPVINWTGNNKMTALLAERYESRQVIKALQKRLDAVDAEIRLAMGESSEAICGQMSVSLRTQTRAPMSSKGSTFRVLRIEKGDNEESEDDVSY